MRNSLAFTFLLSSFRERTYCFRDVRRFLDLHFCFFSATLCLTLLATVVTAADRPIPLSSSIHQTSRIAFASFSTPKPFGSWLQQTLNFNTVKPIFEGLKKMHRGNLQSRAEAHITVITPPEFDKVLSKRLTIKQIEAIAKRHHIQRASFQVKCLGRGRANGDTVYFIVTKSRDLENIRWAVWRAYKQKGGDPALFDPEAFWPHITVGFTKRDLFPEDGVLKGVNSCWKSIKETKRRYK